MSADERPPTVTAELMTSSPSNRDAGSFNSDQLASSWGLQALKPGQIVYNRRFVWLVICGWERYKQAFWNR
jgi:hypothetical protein